VANLFHGNNLNPMTDIYQTRKEIANQYIQGRGIEIGALHSPLEIPLGSQVQYVDRLSVNDLRQQYPELSEVNLVEVDIIDNGETLFTIPDNSQDFVIANQMIEHCQNPIDTMKNFLRVLKPGGIVYLSVPDQRYTFDIERPLTSIHHLIRDNQDGPEWSKIAHYEEYVKLVDKMTGINFINRVNELVNTNYSIHFHVWTLETFSEFLGYCQNNLGFGFNIELSQINHFEFITILRKK
jgi:predicted SAM-dependent methyltransferase